MNYYIKYIKYKTKYNQLKNKQHGGLTSAPPAPIPKRVKYVLPVELILDGDKMVNAYNDLNDIREVIEWLDPYANHDIALFDKRFSMIKIDFGFNAGSSQKKDCNVVYYIYSGKKVLYRIDNLCGFERVGTIEPVGHYGYYVSMTCQTPRNVYGNLWFPKTYKSLISSDIITKGVKIPNIPLLDSLLKRNFGDLKLIWENIDATKSIREVIPNVNNDLIKWQDNYHDDEAFDIADVNVPPQVSPNLNDITFKDYVIYLKEIENNFHNIIRAHLQIITQMHIASGHWSIPYGVTDIILDYAS